MKAKAYGMVFSMTEIEAKDLFGDTETTAIQPAKRIVLTERDDINHPEHYTAGPIECIDGIEAAIAGLDAVEAFLTGCAIKYLWRWKRKNGVDDLKKSQWYINRLIGKHDAR